MYMYSIFVLLKVRMQGHILVSVQWKLTKDIFRLYPKVLYPRSCQLKSAFNQWFTLLKNVNLTKYCLSNFLKFFIDFFFSSGPSY